MSGVKGRSGGARPGSGPKRKERKPLTVDAARDSLEFLLSVQMDPEAEPALRVRAAIAAVQYQHPKIGEGGKKERKQDAADRALGSKFAPAAPPKLVAVKR